MDRRLRGQRGVAGRPVRGRRPDRHAAGIGASAGLRGLPDRTCGAATKPRWPTTPAGCASTRCATHWWPARLGGDARRRARAARRWPSPRRHRRPPPPASAASPIPAASRPISTPRSARASSPRWPSPRAAAGVSGWCMAEVRRVAAEAHPHRHTHAGRVAAAEAFEDALDVAHAQGARAQALRAATSLARVRQELGDDGRAADLLASICARMPEGRGTRDFRAAQAALGRWRVGGVGRFRRDAGYRTRSQHRAHAGTRMTKATTAKTDPDSAAGRAYRFGAFLLRPARRELLADGVPVTLGSRAFDLLAALVEHAGQVVSRDALTAVAWPRMVVEDSSLRVQIAHLQARAGCGRAGHCHGAGSGLPLRRRGAGRGRGGRGGCGGGAGHTGRARAAAPPHRHHRARCRGGPRAGVGAAGAARDLGRHWRHRQDHRGAGRRRAAGRGLCGWDLLPGPRHAARPRAGSCRRVRRGADRRARPRHGRPSAAGGAGRLRLRAGSRDRPARPTGAGAGRGRARHEPPPARRRRRTPPAAAAAGPAPGRRDRRGPRADLRRGAVVRLARRPAGPATR